MQMFQTWEKRLSYCYAQNHNLSYGGLYCGFLRTRIRLWGLIENAKRGGSLLTFAIETTLKCRVWTCLGAFSLSIIMNPNYPYEGYCWNTLVVNRHCGACLKVIDERTLVSPFHLSVIFFFYIISSPFLIHVQVINLLYKLLDYVVLVIHYIAVIAKHFPTLVVGVHR